MTVHHRHHNILHPHQHHHYLPEEHFLGFLENHQILPPILQKFEFLLHHFYHYYHYQNFLHLAHQ
jgi:hypothetical protein